jgi:hypothetical protein
MAALKIHPYADLFPMMNAAELEALAADIAENGLRQPIVRYQAMVLDGRNRLKACEKAGTEPMFVDYEGDDASALALVISLNIQRRDLTGAQRAIVAARRWGMNGYSKGGRPEKGKPFLTGTVSADWLCKQFHIGRTSLLHYKYLPRSCAGIFFAVQVAQGLKKRTRRRAMLSSAIGLALHFPQTFRALHIGSPASILHPPRKPQLVEILAQPAITEPDGNVSSVRPGPRPRSGLLMAGNTARRSCGVA